LEASLTVSRRSIDVQTVFVLGAGFTKAFVPDAPLLVDEYYDEDLGAKFAKFVLEQAEQVTFVGYSLPLTDIAAGTLFREALGHLEPKAIKVISYINPSLAIREQEARKADLLRAYWAVFPDITEAQFHWRGALEWSKEVVAGGS
jgi:hypothetical protein